MLMCCSIRQLYVYLLCFFLCDRKYALHCIFIFSDCNGHPPLNNQRTLSPQNSLKGQRVLTPRNSIKSNRGWSRNNSITSNSVCNAIGVSRQNSINSNKTLNSAGSGTPKDEYKPNNLSVEIPDAKSMEREKNVDDEEDPDAVDETVSGKLIRSRMTMKASILCHQDFKGSQF